ncbi:hypothetical protein WMY93_012174 [Mugilogobius chulae]|uniref:C-type lectin domain-containing protein n=1 Tax=Mugilogobius chulae TaxID=88201 RepID=A0AAW0PAT0_9GOBI
MNYCNSMQNVLFSSQMCPTQSHSNQDVFTHSSYFLKRSFVFATLPFFLERMKLLLLLLLCGTGLCSVIWRNTWNEYDPKTWREAQADCKFKSADLLTIVSQSDIEKAYMDSYYAWIGLRLDGQEWVWDDGTTLYDAGSGSFGEHEPDNGENCALAKYSRDKARGDDCEKRHFYFCHYQDENNERKYKFYYETKSWADAFQFCRDTDNQYLAVFNNWDDFPKNEKRDFPVWTGLYHDGESWKWSDGEYSDFWKWGPGFESGSDNASGLCGVVWSQNASAPCGDVWSQNASGLCGAVWSQNKTMFVHNCSDVFPYLCYSHNLVLVKENMTWEEALEECKVVNSSQRHQLLSVEQSELLFANSKAIDAQTDKVWLGLRFLAGSWFWSNGETVSLPGLPSCPESKLGCGALRLDRTSNGSMPQPT